MGEAFLGEIKIVGFAQAPKGWALCNGQFLPINQNQALFALLGTTYGGNGQTTFALPDLRGRVPIHRSNSHTLGEVGGSEAVTLNISQLPAHTHAVTASNATADSPNASGNFWGSGGQQIYSDSINTALAPAVLNNVGGSQPHENKSPYLVVNFIICLIGLFPSQN